MHLAAIRERLGVQVAINTRTDGVVDDAATAIEDEMLSTSPLSDIRPAQLAARSVNPELPVMFFSAPPVPSPLGSPPWIMNPSMMRWNVRPS